MSKLIKLITLSLLSSALAPPLSASCPSKYGRIVTIGGSITEIVYQLGCYDKIVGSDTSSVYPSRARTMPKIGYWQRLSSEGIISLKPSLVLASSQSRQAHVYKQLKSAGIKVVQVQDKPSIDGAFEKIRTIAKLLNAQKRGHKLIANINKKLSKQKALVAKQKKRPRVLFIYARGTKTLMVSGKHTPADAMIKIAGGQNAASALRGFKPIEAESMIKAAPEVILMMTKGVESLGGKKGVFNLPGLKHTPAGKNQRLVVMDDLLLLGFAGRLGDAATELTEKLHK